MEFGLILNNACSAGSVSAEAKAGVAGVQMAARTMEHAARMRVGVDTVLLSICP
jgi:hypothetical protein